MRKLTMSELFCIPNKQFMNRHLVHMDHTWVVSVVHSGCWRGMCCGSLVRGQSWKKVFHFWCVYPITHLGPKSVCVVTSIWTIPIPHWVGNVGEVIGEGPFCTPKMAPSSCVPPYCSNGPQVVYILACHFIQTSPMGCKCVPGGNKKLVISTVLVDCAQKLENIFGPRPIKPLMVQCGVILINI